MAVWKSVGIWERITYYEITPAVWEALFAPVFVVGGLLIMYLIVRHRDHLELFFWLGLASLGFWLGALLLEFVGLTYLHSAGQWYGVAVYHEESFEIIGSTLLLLGSVLLLRRVLGWGQVRDGNSEDGQAVTDGRASP